jgi:hypothetical protein
MESLIIETPEQTHPAKVIQPPEESSEMGRRWHFAQEIPESGPVFVNVARLRICH